MNGSVKRGLDDAAADRPLYLNWERQGKLWWGEGWLEQHGPVRERIPGFSDHISFANYDLEKNGLPLIQTTAEGRPFVMCINPLDRETLGAVAALAHAWLSDQSAAESWLQTHIYSALAQVSSILNVVAYHGFGPAEMTPGLGYLNVLLPRKDLTRVDYEPPNIT
jgi:hypothetical protein